MNMVLSTPCNGFKGFGLDVVCSDWVLSTPCNGFAVTRYNEKA